MLISDHNESIMHLSQLMLYSVLSSCLTFACDQRPRLHPTDDHSEAFVKMAGPPADARQFYGLHIIDGPPVYATLYGWPSTGGVWTLKPTQEQSDALEELGTTEDMEEHCSMLQQVGATFYPDADEFLERERREAESTGQERREVDPVVLREWTERNQHLCPGGSATDIVQHIAAHVGGKACPHCGVAFEEQVAARS